MRIEVEPIGYVQAPRPHAEDDFWGGEQARIELAPQFAPEALAGLGEFSHIEVLFYFHQVDPAKIVAGARHPRNNQQWPAVGIFAQRGKNRPNRLGTTICTLVRVEGRALLVQELDAIDGTPILDLKPYFPEFDSAKGARVPEWVGRLMKGYF